MAAVRRQRGKCLRCAERGEQCGEFAAIGRALPEIERETGRVPDAQAYAADPLLPGCRARLALSLRDEDLSEVCATCQCCSAQHAALPPLPVADAAVLASVTRVFARVGLEGCFAQSAHDRLALGLSVEKCPYGELGVRDFMECLDRLAPQLSRAPGAFYDLGCGSGRLVCAAALRSGGLFRRSVGVELLPGLCIVAQSLNAAAFEDYTDHEPEMSTGVVQPEILFADFFDVEPRDASLVLVNTIQWEGEALARLQRHLLQTTPVGCLFIGLRKPLANEDATSGLVPLDTFRMTCSWGGADVFLSEHRGAPSVEDVGTHRASSVEDVSTGAEL